MLANIVRRLPSMGGSHFIEARRRDPELLDELLDRDEDELPRWTPAGEEWTQTDELLTKIYDAVVALLAIFAAHPIPAGGHRPQIPSPHVRPERPLDALRRRRLLQRQSDLEEEVERAKERWRASQGADMGDCVVIDHPDN